MVSSDQLISRAFIKLADTMVADFDIIEFLHILARNCVDLLEVSASGILLADDGGSLKLVAASTEQARILGLLQLQAVEGPCVDAYRAGTAVDCPDLAAARERWPGFTPIALAAGFAAVHALPMRLRQQAIGAVSLYSVRPSGLTGDAVALGQGLADVATIGIVHERTLRRQELVTEQLRHALDSRIMIEQAKGVLAERLHIPMEDAFALLRTYARNHNLKLAVAARAITDGTLRITPES